MDPQYISIEEFRELGVLQELNRQFLHPLGLALEVIVDEETNEERLGGIWDCRNDAEGVLYESTSAPEFLEKAKRVSEMVERAKLKRNKELGYFIQPLHDDISI